MTLPSLHKEPLVAVIDLGSNSIKALLATKGATGVRALFSSTRETRIGVGLTDTGFSLSSEAMLAAIKSVQELLIELEAFKPDKTLIVATSAVREALNRQEFSQLLLEQTGHPLKILRGEEEALGIAHGVATDPLLANSPMFSAFDLGGGSLECIHVEGGRVMTAISLPLGAVRLTERWVKNKDQAMTEEAKLGIEKEVNAVLDESSFPWVPCPMVGTSGAFTISRAILAYRLGRSFGELEAQLGLPFLRALFEETAHMPIEERLKIPKLPPSRVDVFPTALLVVLTVAKKLKAEYVQHSQRNLRFGLASSLLEGDFALLA